MERMMRVQDVPLKGMAKKITWAAAGIFGWSQSPLTNDYPTWPGHYRSLAHPRRITRIGRHVTARLVCWKRRKCKERAQIRAQWHGHSGTQGSRTSLNCYKINRRALSSAVRAADS